MSSIERAGTDPRRARPGLAALAFTGAAAFAAIAARAEEPGSAAAFERCAHAPAAVSPEGRWAAGRTDGGRVFLVARDALPSVSGGERDGGSEAVSGAPSEALDCEELAAHRFAPVLWTHGRDVDERATAPLAERRSELAEEVRVERLAFAASDDDGDEGPVLGGRVVRSGHGWYRFTFRPETGEFRFPGPPEGLARELGPQGATFPLRVMSAGYVGAAPVTCELGPDEAVWHETREDVPVRQAPTTAAPRVARVDLEAGEPLELGPEVEGVRYRVPTVWRIPEQLADTPGADSKRDVLRALRAHYPELEPGDRVARYSDDFSGTEGHFQMLYDGAFVSGPIPYPAEVVEPEGTFERTGWWIVTSRSKPRGWIRVSDHPVETSGGFGCQQVLFD